MIALRIAGAIVGVWLGFKMAKIAIEWLKELLESMRPKNIKKQREFDDFDIGRF